MHDILVPLVYLAALVAGLLISGGQDTLHHSETLINHDQRLIEIESHSGDLDNLESKLGLLQDRVSEMKLESSARLYNLEITICLLDKENDEIHKRKVTMNNILAINPSVDRTAVVVDVGI